MLTGNELEELEREYNLPSQLIRLPMGKHEEAVAFIKELDAAKRNRFHPLVLINGNPVIGEGTKIGIFSEVYDKAGIVQIGAGCDIGSFVAINCADSHERTIFPASGKDVVRRAITIGESVFIGSHSFIGPGTSIGDRTVVAAGTIIIGKTVPPYSLVWGAHPCRIRRGYYRGKT